MFLNEIGLEAACIRAVCHSLVLNFASKGNCQCTVLVCGSDAPWHHNKSAG